MPRMRLPVRLPGGRYRKTAIGAALLFLFMLVALLRPMLAPYVGTSGGEAVVTWVIDGDTVVLADGRHVRYLGIDTPEMDGYTAEERRLAQEAKELNMSLVLKRKVRLQYDREKKDKYGRTLAYIWIDDTMVNEGLVEEGLAKAKNYGQRNLVHWDRLVDAQSAAQAAKRGLWASR